MAIKWIDGFDLYSGTISTSVRYNSSYGLGTGRFGTGQALNYQNTTVGFQPFGGSTSSTISVGFAWYAPDVNANQTFFYLRSGGIFGTNILEMRCTGGGTLTMARSGSADIVASPVGTIVANTWHYIEVEILRNSSTGTCKVYVDGSKVMDFTGNTGGSNFDSVAFVGNNNGITWRLDDLYVTDTSTRLGECRVETLRPSADTAQKDWTASTGTNNAAMVDDATYNGDTDYVYSSTVGAKDLYDVADLSYTPNNVYAVQTIFAARKDDATTRTVRANLKSGGTTANGTAKAMAVGYTVAVDIYEQNPNTSTNWTPTTVNAVQVGPEVVS